MEIKELRRNLIELFVIYLFFITAPAEDIEFSLEIVLFKMWIKCPNFVILGNLDTLNKSGS